jgi:hypothetical protein
LVGSRHHGPAAGEADVYDIAKVSRLVFCHAVASRPASLANVLAFGKGLPDVASAISAKIPDGRGIIAADAGK